MTKELNVINKIDRGFAVSLCLRLLSLLKLLLRNRVSLAMS